LIQIFGRAEVNEDGAVRRAEHHVAAGGSKHDVRGLYVPMNNASRPNFRNGNRDIASYAQHFGFQQPSAFQPIAERLSVDEFPRDVSRVSTGHVTIAMLNQPRQVWMRDVLHRGDLGLYTNVPSAIEVQLQSYNVMCRGAVWPRSSGRPENCSLATNGNFGTNAVAPTQRSIYICRDKLADILVDSHTIYRVSRLVRLRFLFHRIAESYNQVYAANSSIRRRFFGGWG
jgi:hypothetical protein